MHAFTAAGADATQLLGVEVDEFAGVRPAVAHRRLVRVEQAPGGAGGSAEACDRRSPGRARGARRCAPSPRRGIATRSRTTLAQALADDAQRDPVRTRGAVEEACRPPSARQRVSHLLAVWRLTPAAAAALADPPALMLDPLAEQQASMRRERRALR